MIKNNLKKNIKMITAAAAVLSMCALTACGGGTASSTGTENGSAGEDLKKVTLLLDWTPNTNHTGIYAAQELGYFAEAGLDVDIEMPAGGTATQLVGAGKGDFGISNTDDTLYAVTLDDPMPVEDMVLMDWIE